MENYLRKYEQVLRNMDYEVIHTPKLGWIIIRTDYEHYSNPIIPLHSPQELEEYILNVK